MKAMLNETFGAGGYGVVDFIFRTCRQAERLLFFAEGAATCMNGRFSDLVIVWAQRLPYPCFKQQVQFAGP